MNSGILILAAGSSRRFGSDKRIAELADGRTLLDTTIDNCIASGLPLRICLGSSDRAMALTLERRGIAVVTCPNAGQGMGATLADAATAIQGWSAALVALGDMPMIQPRTIATIAEHATPDGICVPQFDQRPGHPVAFGLGFFTLLSQCDGDRGARWIIAAHPQAIRYLPVDDPGILRDIDTPAALQQL